MKRRMTAFCMSAVLILVAGMGAQDRTTQAGRARENAADKLVASTTYSSDNTLRQLTVWSKSIPRPSDSVFRAYILSRPNTTSFPNLAYYLMDSPAGKLSEGK